MKHIVLVLAFVLMSVTSWAYPRIQNPVEDYADVLTTAQENEISHAITGILPGAQVAVLTVDNTNGEPIEDFSHATAELWRGGTAELNNGVLVVISVGTHKTRIEVGSGLESAITDTESRTILEGARPSLRGGDYGAAISGIVASIGREVGAFPTAPVSPVRTRVSTPVPTNDGSGDFLLPIVLFLGVGGGLTWWLVRRSHTPSYSNREDWSIRDSWDPPQPVYVPTPVVIQKPIPEPEVVVKTVPASDVIFGDPPVVPRVTQKATYWTGSDGRYTTGEDMAKVLGDLGRVTADFGPIFGDLGRAIKATGMEEALEDNRRRERERREDDERDRREAEDESARRRQRERDEDDRRARERREEEERDLRRREEEDSARRSSYSSSDSSPIFSSWGSSDSSSSSSDSSSSWSSSDSGGSFDGGGSSSDW